ncbi:MAG: hypothetical protein JRN52_09930 [Nitrososphaerota archaeon]|nr:hypothetical protein [Nitrososphaerota archaeon]
MASKDLGEDLAFFLYLAPIVASIVYGAYEWLQVSRSSALMPGRAYLIVSKSPYLFLFSVVVICAALLAEVRTSEKTARENIVRSNIRRMQILSIVVLIISFAGAISVGSYDLGNAVSVFVAGRYAIIYAFFLIGTSLLLSYQELLGNLKLGSLPEIVGLILLAASPLVFYVGVKLHLPFAASSVGAIVVAIIGLALLLRNTMTVAAKRSVQKTSEVVAKH